MSNNPASLPHPTDEEYRDAAVMMRDTVVAQDAEVTRLSNGAYVTVRVWVSAGAAKAP